MHYCLKHLQTTVAQYNIIPSNLTFCMVLHLQKQNWPAHWLDSALFQLLESKKWGINLHKIAVHYPVL